LAIIITYETTHRLKLYWKLFVVMGVSWVFELASWAYPGPSCWAWIFTDTLNMLQGLWSLFKSYFSYA
jgi:hypothetical protein